MLHLETAEAFRLRIRHLDIIHAGPRRPISHLVDKPPHGGQVAFKMRFHRGIRVIADPAGHSAALGLIARPGSKEYALNTTSYADMFGDPHSSAAKAGA